MNMNKLRYVDLDGLVCYDGELKKYIDQKYATTEDLLNATTIQDAEGKEVSIVTEVEANTSAIGQEVTDRTNAIADLDSAYKAADETLTSSVNALDERIDAYDTRFGSASDILVFDCGTSTVNI